MAVDGNRVQGEVSDASDAKELNVEGLLLGLLRALLKESGRS